MTVSEENSESLHGAELAPIAQGDLLSSFGKETAWVIDAIPIAHGAAQLLNGYFEGTIDHFVETLADYRENPGEDTLMSRRAARVATGNTGGWMQMTGALSSVVAKIDDPEEKRQTVERLVRHFTRPIPSLKETIITSFLGGIEEHNAHVATLNESSTMLAEEIGDAMKDDPSVEYDLIRLIVGTDPSKPDDESHFSPRDAFSFMLNAVNQDSDSTFVTRLADRLESGAFDHFLAADLLYLERRRGEDRTRTPTHIGNLQRLLEDCNPELAGETIDERLVESFGKGLWFTEARLALYNARSIILQRLQTINRSQLKDAQRYGLRIPAGDPEEVFEQAQDTYFSGLGAKEAILTFMTKDERVRDSLKRRRRSITRGRKPKKAAPLPAPEVLPSQEKKVVCVSHTTGERYEQDDDEFRKILTQRLASDTRSVAGLDADLDRMVNYLSRLDFSRGRISGIFKQGDPIKITEGETVVETADVFELKPTESPGLGVRTKYAKSLRVQFALLDQGQTIGIIAVVNRGKRATVTKQMGRRSSGISN
jgi:hypothetical protein